MLAIDQKTLQEDTLKNCNSIRAIVMIIIVINHCIAIYALNSYGGWLPIASPAFSPRIFEWIGTWFSSFMNYTFVIVSGYVYYAMRFEKEKYTKFFPFVANKAKRLLLPAAFISVLWIIPICMLVLDFGWKDIFYNFALGVFPRQLWFVFMLFWVFVIFAPFAKRINKSFILGLLFVGLCYLVGRFGIKITGGVNYYRIFDGFSYVVYFWVGFCLRKYGLHLLLKIPSLVWLAFNVIMIILQKFIIGLELPKLLSTASNLIVPLLVQLSGSMMAFMILQKILLKYKPKSKFLTVFAKYSFPIFMIHEQFIYLAVVWYEGKINPYVFPIITFVWVMVLSFVICYLLGKFKTTRLLMGMK